MKNRYKESIAPLFEAKFKPHNPLLYFSPSDIGVRRNGGRNGARFAPAAVLSCLKKLQNHLSYHCLSWKVVSDQVEEKNNFKEAQLQESLEINKNFKKIAPNKIIHIGGGHDHVYPLLKGLQASFKKIIILNFDAHCDTRDEEKSHSGTPFRDFDHEMVSQTHLLQIGIHNYANAKSTLTPLKKIDQEIAYMDADRKLIQEIERFLAQNSPCSETLILISVDCDGFRAAEMEAVSAVNHNGFSSQLVRETLSLLNDNYPQSFQTLGFYEYNPLYDNLSQKGARLVAGIIYDFLEREK